MKMKRNCLNCRKEIKNKNLKYCSWKCYLPHHVWKRSDVQKRLSERALKVLKTKKLGFFDKNLHKIWSQHGIKRKGGYNAAKVNKINHTSFYNAQIQRMGGLAAICMHRKNKPHWYKNIPFASKSEMKIAIKFDKNKIIKLKENETCHIRINGHEFDFLIDKTFIEYHPWDSAQRNFEQYYFDRRKILDSNGLNSYKLIVFKNLNEVNDFVNRRFC